MRILIASSHRNVVGGVEKYLQKVLPGLADRGHQLALLYEYRFDPGRESIESADLTIPCRGIAESGVDAGLRFVTDWKPDVVYSQGMEAVEVQAALLNGYPTVLYAHNYVGTCASEQKCHTFPSPQSCDRHFGPMCLALYYPRRCGGLHPGTMWKMYQQSAKRNLQIQDYLAVLVASAHMRREFERHGVKPKRIHLVPLPNPNETAPSEFHNKISSCHNLLFIGRLTKLKGAAHLLGAIPLAEKRLERPLSATVAGDGPELARLQELAARKQVKAEFAGWVGPQRKLELMRKADLLVVPSLWPEPFGLVGIEAGAYGIPAVAYDVGGISDWLIPGYSGELAAGHPPTAVGLADAIVRALSDASHYEDLSRGAREVASRFTLAAHVSKLEAILNSVRQAPAGLGHGEEAIHAEV
jgi:glycosyltransferase involved in cell wall biosynthesis